MANAGPAADDADPDDDYQFTCLEYHGETDPKLPTSALAFDAAPARAALGSLRLEPVKTGVRYVVQVSNDDLLTWNDRPAVQYDAPADRIMLTDSTAPTGVPRFYWLRLDEVL